MNAFPNLVDGLDGFRRRGGWVPRYVDGFRGGDDAAQHGVGRGNISAGRRLLAFLYFNLDPATIYLGDSGVCSSVSCWAATPPYGAINPPRCWA